MEFGESWEECARREAREELGIEITNTQFLGVTNDVFVEENKHYITIYLRADLTSGTPKIMEPEKTIAMAWTTWEEFPEPMFLPIKHFLEGPFSPIRNDRS